MKISDDVLVESKSARDQSLVVIQTEVLQQDLLNRVKPLIFALWQASSYMTTKQVAEFYEVPESTIRQNYLRFKPEFDADGVEKLTGKDLKEVRDSLSLSSFAPKAMLFSPRAVIRMGFILQGSPVAAQVRTAVLNIVQGVGHLFEPQVIHALISGYPVLNAFAGSSDLTVSAPLALYYQSIERHLKSKYPDGGIPGLSKQQIRDRLAALSTYTEKWKFDTQKELRYSLGNSVATKYPDLLTQPFPLVVDGRSRSAVLMFHLAETLVDVPDIEVAVGRQYLKRATEHLSVDYAFLFLAAPFGATPRAEASIRQDLPQEMKGFVGVMTIKEVAETLVAQAKAERKTNLVRGEIKRNFKDILDYEIPTRPLLLMTQP